MGTKKMMNQKKGLSTPKPPNSLKKSPLVEAKEASLKKLQIKRKKLKRKLKQKLKRRLNRKSNLQRRPKGERLPPKKQKRPKLFKKSLLLQSNRKQINPLPPLCL